MDGPVLRFCIVGAGQIAQSHAAAFPSLPQVKLSAVADILPGAAQALASELPECRPFGSLEAMLASESIDAAIVCTPPATHEAICRTLLRNGVDILCEKPLSTDAASARAMADSASSRGRILAVTSKYLHVADVRKAKELIDSGRIGRLLWIDIVFTAALDMTESWHSDPLVSGGGVLMDNGPHVIDIVRYLAGPIDAIQATQFPSTGNLQVEETVQLLLRRSASGAMGRAHLSWSLHEPVDYYARITGSSGMVELGWRQSTLFPPAPAPGVPIGSGYAKIPAFERQLRHFCAAVRGRPSGSVRCEEAVTSMQVLQAAYRSMAEGKWLTVAP